MSKSVLIDGGDVGQEECSKQKEQHLQGSEEGERMVFPENQKQASMSGARKAMWPLVWDGAKHVAGARSWRTLKAGFPIFQLGLPTSICRPLPNCISIIFSLKLCYTKWLAHQKGWYAHLSATGGGVWGRAWDYCKYINLFAQQSWSE